MAIQKFVVSDQSKKFQSVIPAPYQVRGRLRQVLIDPSLRWDDSGDLGPWFFACFFIKKKSMKIVEKITALLNDICILNELIIQLIRGLKWQMRVYVML